MLNREFIHKLLWGDRGGTILWKVPLGEIEYEPISDPAEGVAIATLAENILKVGLLQPILLWKPESPRSGACYRLIAGRRRLEALRMLGKTHASAIVITCDEADLSLLALSDNSLRRDVDAFAMADDLSALLCRGYTVSRLSRLLGLPSVTLDRLLEVRALSDEHRRLLKMCGASMANAIALAQIPDELHGAVLRRAAADPTVSLTWLAEEYCNDPTSFALQFHKIWSADLKLFANTLHRSVRTMEQAGFQCEVVHQESEDDVSFTIRLCKASSAASIQSHPIVHKNVSRETFLCDAVELEVLEQGKPMPFEVYAMAGADEGSEEKTKNVSRETLHRNVYKNKRNQKENAEKLEICIDESGKR